MVRKELVAHMQEVCDGSEQALANPQEYFKKLLVIQPVTPPAVQDDATILMDLLLDILQEFEKASVANYLGDAFLFYKFFTHTLFEAISVHAWLRSNPDWRNPPNYINQIGNEVEQKFLGGIFPEINQEVANRNKLDFIDWFGDVLDDLGGKGNLKEMPVPIAQIKQFLQAVYRRDYLVNFRAVSHLKGIYRSPNPAKFTTEGDLLERFLVNHNITLTIDLRGEQEAQRSVYIGDLLKKHQIKTLIVDFNEPNSTEIIGSAYKKKAYFLKNEVKKVFRAILGNPGSTLFHCASGKDRTGIIAAILQKLAGVTGPDILAEYQRSGLDTRPEKIQDVLQYIEQQGGIGKYLEACGLSHADQEKLKVKMAP